MGPGSFQIRIWGLGRWLAPTKSGAPCNFYFLKITPKCMAEAVEATWTPFMHPIPRVWGVPGQPPRTFQPSKTTSMPNYIPIRPKVWTSIKNTHTSCPLYSRIWWGAFSKLVSIICWNVKKKLDINDQDLSNLAKQREKVLFLPDICFAWLPRRASL